MAGWQDTRDTLHLYTQVVGKIRLAREPLVNHWWNTTLYLTAKGPTTSLRPHPSGPAFQVDFDFLEHGLDITSIDGAARSLALEDRPVADFHAAVMPMLDDVGVATTIWPVPVVIPDAISFAEDRVHDRDAVRRLRDLPHPLRREGEPGAPILGDRSTRLHALLRPAGTPPHPGGAPRCGPQVIREAYSHEVSSCGYWPRPPGEEGVFYAAPTRVRPAIATQPSRRPVLTSTTSSASSSCPTSWCAPPTTRTRHCSRSCSPPTKRPPPQRAGNATSSSDRTERTTMPDTCTHLDTVADVTPSSNGCEDCERIGGHWMHLRLCMRVGHVGCCDNSPNRYATAHWHEHTDHPLIRSYEPGEDW